MTEFTGHIQPDTDIGFGDFVEIQMSWGEKYIHKVVSSFGSNTWVETPLRLWSDDPIMHKSVEDVLNVIQCGIDETKVIRVAVKDVKKVEFK